MQTITTSGNREAYRDLAYTHMTDPANAARIQRGWAAQATEVLKAKVAHAGPRQGDFAALYAKIDGANQAAKDIEQRLLPALRARLAGSSGKKAAELSQDIDRFREIQRALEKVETDPVGAGRQLRVLTGADSIGEAADLVSKRFLGAVTLQ